MNKTTELSRNEVIKANIYVHSSIVEQYNNEPHFRPENLKVVRARLEQLRNGIKIDNPERLLDFGCGTGFIINLIKNLFDRIDGVDVTQAMLDKVDTSSGNIFLHQCAAEDTPFENTTFDMATAYSFMDHLLDYKALLSEAYRVLKKNGLMYVDLNPNREFWNALHDIDQSGENTSELVKKEIFATVHNDERVSEQYNIDKDELIRAEPTKNQEFGFDADEVLNTAREIGFSDCNVRYHWYLGQAKVMHGQSMGLASEIDQHLQNLLPLTSPLYKYLEFVFVK